MKRSKTTALLLMSAAPLLFSACQLEPQGQLQEGVYTSVDNCARATGESSTCQQAFETAQQQAADSAPQFASREACEQEYDADQCVEQQTRSGTSFIGPMMAGFFMSQMLQGRAASATAAAPAAAPAFRDKANGWARPASPGMTGANRTALTPITSQPNRAVTASRGGFGDKSRKRTSSGG
ncbi:DUF1190 domain-containing protein [Novilysobacter avium]|uniref:DUF1190 domain-containing protein n=1 Tax=Novilysobacter avium TaxID=2781023 RepID=A0A7S6UME5_9GAMM|nr:DUF1190 domain-containing protein [Lysobacter avium]QOW22935.1 DUF1190 domain-containing protein [Lysobacter avium]